jgi:hypothetical protein
VLSGSLRGEKHVEKVCVVTLHRSTPGF